MIHVYLEKAKNMRPRNNVEAVNGLFCFEICGKKMYSAVKENIATFQDTVTTNWYEHLYFELKDLKSDDVKEAVV